MLLITNYRDDLLEDLVQFWNFSFNAKRNFITVTPQILRSYCVDGDDFDPEGLFLAVENHEIVGMGHAGFARKGCDQDNGLIHVLAVRPDMRRKGIGEQLLNACELFLSEASTITIGAMGLDLFYSHSGSSLCPLWGSSEGIGLEANDNETRSFLEKRGYRHLDSTVSMVGDLSNLPRPFVNMDKVVFVPNRWIMVNLHLPLSDAANDFLPPPVACESLVYLDEGIVAGKIVVFSMFQLDMKRAAIVDFWVHQLYRGKGIGSLLLDAALHHLMRRGFDKVELVADPLKNRVAYAMYRRRGFRTVAEWCSYQRSFSLRIFMIVW